jgi:hypothetical protein
MATPRDCIGCSSHAVRGGTVFDAHDDCDAVVDDGPNAAILVRLLQRDAAAGRCVMRTQIEAPPDAYRAIDIRRA